MLSRNLEELEPRLLELVNGAMTESIKAGALELKRSFEQQLHRNLDIRIHELVEQAVERACREEDK